MAGVPDTGRTEQSWENRAQQIVVVQLKDSPYSRGWPMNCGGKDLERAKEKNAGRVLRVPGGGKGPGLSEDL